MISVVILTYNTRELTIKCLNHLLKSKGLDLEVIVVDNASTDGTGEEIKRRYQDIKIIENKKNIGFAAGNNQGMKIAKGDKILLLNSDCFVNPDSIANIPDTDVVGCKLLNKGGSVQPSWGYFPTLRRITQLMLFVDNFPLIRKYIDSIHVRDVSRYETEQEVDWVTGAFVILKRKVFEEVGGIDEKYFMYGEEMEWMYRIKKAGFNVWYSPAATAVHLQGASTKSKAVMFLSQMKGFLYWFKKHNSPIESKILRFVLLIGCVIRIPAWAVWARWDLVKAYWQVLPELAGEVFGRTRK